MPKKTKGKSKSVKNKTCKSGPDPFRMLKKTLKTAFKVWAVGTLISRKMVQKPGVHGPSSVFHNAKKKRRKTRKRRRKSRKSKK